MFYLNYSCFYASDLFTLYLETNHKVQCSKLQVQSSMLQVQSYKALSVSESNLSQSMPAHESTLIHVAIDTVQLSLTGILPHFKVSSILEHWFSLGILCYHQLVAVELSQEIMVIEVGTRIDERLLPVCLFHETQELEE